MIQYINALRYEDVKNQDYDLIVFGIVFLTLLQNLNKRNALNEGRSKLETAAKILHIVNRILIHHGFYMEVILFNSDNNLFLKKGLEI